MSKMEPTVLIGAGGHAKVCIEVLRSHGLFNPVACIDPNSEVSNVFGVKVYSSDDKLQFLYDNGVRCAFIALGQNRLRANLGADVRLAGFRLVNAISPQAFISPSAKLGEGVLIMPGAVINAEATLGDLCIVNTNAVIEHDCHLGSACHVAPGAVLCGRVRLEERAFIGAGAVVIPERLIETDAIVGAGAVVIDDVAAGMTVIGIPARYLSR